MTRNFQSAFTIVELAVAISVTLILAVIFFYAGRAALDRSKNIKCVSNLRQIGVAMGSYLADNDQRMPTTTGHGYVPVLAPYLGENCNIYRCPADNYLQGPTDCSYYWNIVINGQRAANLGFYMDNKPIFNRRDIILFGEERTPHQRINYGQNFLYADGSVEARNRQLDAYLGR